MTEAKPTDPGGGHDPLWDVAVIGGGAAGLGGAVALARSRRSVVVIDAGQPRNAPAAHAHNFLTRDGIAPSQLLAAGRDEVTAYGGTVVAGTVTSAARTDDGIFRLALGDGTTLGARRLLLTAGLVDDLPAVDGVAQRWGRDVLHCPYCHGWEVRDRRICVLASTPLAVHAALLWRQLSADVTVVQHTAPAFDAAQHERLAARGIRVIGGHAVALDVDADRLTGVRLADGGRVECDAVVVQPVFTARTDLLAGLGLSAAEQRVDDHVIATYVPADGTGATDAPGVWVAGNVADPSATLISSAAAGMRAGAVINADLVTEDTDRALARHRGADERAAEPQATNRHATANEHAAHEPATGEWHMTPVRDDDTAATYWDRFHAEPHPRWSGDPNGVLVREITGMAPGTALDLGCGEGADAVWLAQQGWAVTAVDVAAPVLGRARARAETAGVTDRIAWVREDLARWEATGTYDLVTTHYLHSPIDLPRAEILRAAAAAVAPGGVLLVVGHTGPVPAHAGGDGVARLPTPAEVVADLGLDPAQWQVVLAAEVPRGTGGVDGHPHTRVDAVVRVQRVAPAARA